MPKHQTFTSKKAWLKDDIKMYARTYKMPIALIKDN